MKMIVRFIIQVGVIIALSYLMPKIGFEQFGVDSVADALKIAIVLGLLNLFIRPILKIIAFPITCITMGLFSFVINALIVLLADNLLEGFHTGGFWAALVFSIAYAFASSSISSIIIDND
ncbi:MAG: phage holin family protein [Chitinophagales bacterium]|nr:phage holin family protein [Chitinophagales bacterium]